MRIVPKVSILVVASLLAAAAGCGSDKDPNGVSATGGLRVWVVADGPDTGEFLFEVIVDGTESRSVTAQTPATFTGLAPGTHAVRMEGMPGNCHLDGSAVQTVTVVAGSTATATFSVACDAVVAGRWAYSASLDLGVPCTMILTLDLEQIASAFHGMATTGRLSCPSIGFLESFEGGPIANGRVERTVVEFDFGDATWHHTGHYAGNQLSGGFVLRFDDGTSLSGGWTATRTSGLVQSRQTGGGEVAADGAPALLEIADRIRRSLR